MDDQPQSFCSECGAVDQEKTHLRERLDDQQILLEHLTQELARLRRQLNAARREEAEQRSLSPYAKDARKIFDYWREKLSPRAREFTGIRFDAVVARLAAGQSVDYLKLAIDGAAARPYVSAKGRMPTGPKEDRQVELELIMRSEAHVQRFASYADPEELDVVAKESEASRAGATMGAERAAQSLDEARLRHYQEQMHPGVVDRLVELRGWDPAAVRDLGLGLDRDRIVFPIRDSAGTLVGMHRFQPNPEKRHGPKMIAEGARDLFPRPESYENGTVFLVEGEPDAVAAISAGLQAVGVPGVGTWKAGWANRFEKFDHVVIAFDCDSAGRDNAHARARTLGSVTRATVVELNASRTDGWDVGDLCKQYGSDAPRHLWSLIDHAPSVAPMRLVQPPVVGNHKPLSMDPMENVLNALQARGMRVSRQAGGFSAQCPAHEDRHASLSLSQGVDGRALLKCHTGCSNDAVVAALGLEWKDLFAEEAS